eukprot:10810583-Lingulodinium_polyedra.AAC.1
MPKSITPAFIYPWPTFGQLVVGDVRLFHQRNLLYWDPRDLHRWPRQQKPSIPIRAALRAGDRELGEV